MRPFLYQRVDNLAEAVQASGGFERDTLATLAAAQFSCGQHDNPRLDETGCHATQAARRH